MPSDVESSENNYKGAQSVDERLNSPLRCLFCNLAGVKASHRDFLQHNSLLIMCCEALANNFPALSKSKLRFHPKLWLSSGSVLASYQAKRILGDILVLAFG